jgi:uncharacterized membrane protein
MIRRETPVRISETIIRIDNNIKWIMRVGVVVGSIILMLGGALFTRDWAQSEAIASLRTDVATTIERVHNHINGVHK